MKKVFTILSVLFVASVAGLGYFVFCTPAPYQMVAGLLQKSGFQVTGVTGNINSGFSVAHIERKDADFEFVADNVALSHNSILDALVNKRLVIQNFDIGKLHLKFLKPLQEFKSKWAKSEADKPGEKSDKRDWKKTATEQAKAKLNEFRVTLVHIKDVKIETPDLPEPWTLSELTVGDLVVKDKDFSLQKVVLRSGTFDLDVKGLQIDELGVRHEDKITGVIHPSASNKFTKDVAMALKVETRDKKTEGEISLFDSKLSAQFSGTGPFSMQLTDFSPADYFKVELPLQSANVKVELPNILFALMAPIPFSGQFKWRQIPFSFPPAAPATPAAGAGAGAQGLTAMLQAMPGSNGPQLATYQKGKDHYFISFKPQFDLVKKSLDMTKPWFELSSIPVRSKRETLSFLYFGKAYAKLKADEKSMVEKDEFYFSEPPLVQMGNRVPASVPTTVPAAVPARATPVSTPNGSASHTSKVDTQLHR